MKILFGVQYLSLEYEHYYFVIGISLVTMLSSGYDKTITNFEVENEI